MAWYANRGSTGTSRQAAGVARDAWAGERTAGPPAPAKPTRGPNGTNRLLFFFGSENV